MDKTPEQLRSRVASLETTVDMLESELSYLNEMLMRCGFRDGVSTLKETVEDLLEEEEESFYRDL